MFQEIGLVTGKNAKIAGRDARLRAFWGRFNRGAQGPAAARRALRPTHRPAFAEASAGKSAASKICVKINF
jgi:hypothetical protein